MSPHNNWNADDSPVSSGVVVSSRRNKKNGKQTVPYNNPEGTDNIELHADISEFVRATDVLHQAMTSASELFQRYKRDIGEAAENRERASELEDLCLIKDQEIEKRKNALEVMLERNERDAAKVEQDQMILAEERKKFELLKDDFQKSKHAEETKARELEVARSRQYDTKIEKAIAANEKAFKERQETLEKTTKKREEFDKKMIGDLEIKKTKLSAELDACKAQIQRQKIEITTLQQKVQKVEQLREVSDNEVLRLQGKLKRVRNEFMLTAKTPAFYTEGFAEVYSQIASISGRYFAQLKVDAPKAQETILELDPIFGLIPFSNSVDSAKLREAHVQRVITAQLCAIIWQPFSCEKTLQNPDLSKILSEIATVLSVDGDRKARVWSTLTSKGLSCLVTDQSSSRVQMFVRGVLRVLSELVPSVQRSHLESDLSGLAEAAIRLWNEAQQDELDISLCQILDPKCHGQWLSTFFEPEKTRAPSIKDRNTPQKVQLLFPRVTAKKQVTTDENRHVVSGSSETSLTSQDSQRLETIQIHPGLGLAEWSALVVRGKAEAEKIRLDRELEQKLCAEAVEKTKKEFYAKRGVRSSTSCPSSPSDT